ncbi:MAG: amidohydrolase [Halobacteriaceae archaeon]
MDQELREQLVELRRDLHQHPEPAWCEFYTTARIIEAIREIGVDDLYLGEDVVTAADRMAVPPESELSAWREQAIQDGADPELVEQMADGFTGAIAVLRRGEGPTVGLRVDIDALRRSESGDPDHRPAAEGFRSTHPETMHACGHDAHAAFGVGVLATIAASGFEGTLKVFFQPAEEQVGGGKAIATSGHLDDVDALLAVHVGLDHPTGEIVAGIDGFLAVKHLEATFSGTAAHAGGRPNEGANANQAVATAASQLYAIPRHEDGATRVNAGEIHGGTASNIIAEDAELIGEVRGETTALKDYMWDKATRVVEHAAGMHGCEATVTTAGEAPSATSDQALVDIVLGVARELEGVESPIERDELGGSEDATYLMQRVQEQGGLATYVGVGTDHPGGHHTATFDVDEDSIPIGVDLLAGAIERIATDGPHHRTEATPVENDPGEETSPAASDGAASDEQPNPTE